MNLEVLKILMKEKHIASYYQLANFIDVPYTSLLDLVHGRSKNLDNFKQIATYFEVPASILFEPTTYYGVITEENELKFYFPTDQYEQINAFVSLLNSGV